MLGARVLTLGIEESRSDRKGPYSYFISALQSNQNFAPAYTALGIFYADITEDTTRANKCFQKAFELSAGEVEAAERLARSFAESREWELVEIVARRVADADKKRSVPGNGVSWPQSAIGVVELVSLCQKPPYPITTNINECDLVSRTRKIIRRLYRLFKPLSVSPPTTTTPGLDSAKPTPPRAAMSPPQKSSIKLRN